jgi:hypothetical protein
MAVKTHWRRRVATGANAVVVSILLVVTGGLALEVLDRAHWQLDVSEQADATVSPELASALEAVAADGRPFTITAFSAQQRDDEARVRDRMTRDLLRELEGRCPQIQTEFIDFDADRMAVERMRVTRYGTWVVEGHGDRVDVAEREIFKSGGPKGARQLTFLGEPSIARAIGKILAGHDTTVYTLVGHGERKFDDAVNATGALKGLAEQFSRQGWRSKPLNLLRDRRDGASIAVPADAAAVLVVGPKAPLAAEEEAALAQYLSNGGRVALFADPGGSVPDFLDRVGVVVSSGVVLDPTFVYPNPDRPVLRYGRHPITEPLFDSAGATLVASAAPVSVTGGAVVTTLLETSRAGWAERGTEQPAQFDAGVDGEGPVSVAVAAEITSGSGRLARVVVVGDTNVVDDELVESGPGNAAFAVNLVRWLIGEEDRMMRGGRAVAIRKLQLSPDQLNGVRWLVLGFVPMFAVIVGAVIAWLRRDR